MKALIYYLPLVLLFFGVSTPCQGEDNDKYVSYFVRLTDSNHAPSVHFSPEDELEITFSDPQLNQIAESYKFRQFHKAFGNSSDPQKQLIYLVEVDNPEFLHGLFAYDSVVYDSFWIAEYMTSIITITDSLFFPNVEYDNIHQATVSFGDPLLNGIAANYTFKEFRQAFPNSIDKKNDYLVSVNSLDFMDDLASFNNTIFMNHYCPIKPQEGRNRTSILKISAYL